MRFLLPLVAILTLSPAYGRADNSQSGGAKSGAAKAASTKTNAEKKNDHAGPLKELPARMTVKQRSTAVVPGSDGKLQVTVDDITRGQVITSVSHSKHGVLIGPTSLRAGDSKKFELDSTTYQIRLKALNNALIGDDFGEFVIGYPPEPIPEREKIEKLIAAVAESPAETTFERAGKPRSPKSEAEYLRKRNEAWKTKDLTAEAFIERLSAKASDEEPYLVRAVGTPALSMEAFLRAKLREIESEE
jgi:hypothetical protein